MRRFKSANREQPFLFPPTIDDFLGDNHLARYIVQIIDRLDLSKIYQSYSFRGSDPFDPKLLMGLLFYGYSTGMFSSRKLEKATYESIPLMFISGGLHPDHATINDFRKRFFTQIEDCFTEILLIAEEVGILKLGNIHLDGTKIKANASKHKAMSFKRINEREEAIRTEIQELMKMADEFTENEALELDIPEEITRREGLLDRLDEAAKEIRSRASRRYETEKAEYEEKLKRREEKAKKRGEKPRGKEPKAPTDEPEDKDQYNFTDPESRIMKTGDGFQQCYNAQAAVDEKSRLIVGHTLSNHGNDKQELLPILESIPSDIGDVKCFVADNGYYSDKNVKESENRGMDPLIATGRQSHHSWLKEFGTQHEKIADIKLTTIERMTQKLRSVEGKEIYRLRKSTVETTFGIIKEVMGFRRFSFRGEQKVSKEWSLVCLAYNLKRMFNVSTV